MINPNDPAFPGARTADVRVDTFRTDIPASTASAVSWGAILAGAAGAAALSLILLILGTGLGLSSISPWVNSGVSATTLGVSTILWITFTQLAAAGVGGYLAGRLRTRWIATHVDEVYFRDTAHGFLAWSIATLATAALLTSTIGAILGGGAQVAATAGGAATVAASAGSIEMMGKDNSPGAGRPDVTYFVDSLFRSTSMPSQPAHTDSAAMNDPMLAPQAAPMPMPMRGDMHSPGEAARIFSHGLAAGDLTDEDSRYLSGLVSERTGVSQQEASRRVTETYQRAQTTLRDAEAKAKAAADTARKASAYAALWLFVSLLIGAFVASLFATFGGRQRDA